jgi:hypothetical protein
MIITLKIISDFLNSLDLKDLWKFANWHQYFKYLNMPAGKEHYRLFSHLSWQFPPNTTLIDVGTHIGYSALALSHNPDVNVISYNIQDDIGNQNYSVKNKHNIELRIKNCLEDINLLLKSPLIVLDTLHNGDFEKEFMELLIKNNYDGIVICDDIHLNDAMINFWNWIPLKKIDITQFGHWSGTGIVLFNENKYNLEIL